ncbi:MAG: ABC transporter ATP-binding protein [candidate division KSB1 bacterium]|nr:ABC transporter ATP-binding protein [candidate division KSB1 bacterium]MDQ7065128.1 ABC transporter ATP-binding protein [candidate division KSB1 bacterium]
MAIIEFKNVSRRYGAVYALKAFDYSFRESEITAVVGRSGSGKSTLLQLINGLIRPSDGQVSVFGQPIDYDRVMALRRKIGYAVQGTGLFPHLTVAENIGLPARLVGWPESRRRQRVCELMELVSLPAEFHSRYPHELSGGQQQRVGLCRAMMLDPDILLFDEPFGALDPITRSDLHQEVLRLQALQPRTIVLVTHDMREAFKLATELLILEDGQLVQAGRRETILQHPATPFIRNLIHTQLELS